MERLVGVGADEKNDPVALVLELGYFATLSVERLRFEWGCVVTAKKLNLLAEFERRKLPWGVSI